MGKKMRVIDLTYSLEEGMTTFAAPWHPLVQINQLGRHGFEGRETRKISMGTHTGTHVDAPLHFISGGKTIDMLPLEKLVGEVSILDFSHLEENQAVTREMLLDRKIGPRTIVRFGWGKHWGSKKYYAGYPYFSPEAAAYLVEQGVELLGMDTPSPDDSRAKLGGDAQDSPMHKYFLGHEVILMEYLANLEEADENTSWCVAALPLKIRGGDGAPARVCLFTWEEEA